ncbi:hypothetical protein HNR19_003628 [Nocardioides thalensis]|uniref:Uncharacterized protein n=1 Tax=Nocardioides thalensis TaxID=1914755 RepID=A0A853C489_9ACTN|nr:hypothetical protein [Nocardioides thalensis]NYJ02930.1 hypothetical protein [Nocardioides thalensis]
MGSDMEFGPDTESIRRWLEKRQTYKGDGGKHRGDEASQEAVFVTASAPRRAAGPDTRAAGRSVLEAIGADVPPPATRHEPGGHDAGRSVLEALGTISPRPASEPAPQPATEERAEAALATTPAAAVPATEVPPATSSGRSTDVTFAPRHGIRRAMSFALFGVLLAAAAAGLYAYRDPSFATYGVAATCGVLVLAVWAVRAGATATHVRIHRGQLEIQRGGTLEVADLSNPYTPVAVIGVPGRRGWLVLVERPGRPVLEVDASLVDPGRFMDSLLRLRPDVRDWARANRPELLESMESWNVF